MVPLILSFAFFCGSIGLLFGVLFRTEQQAQAGGLMLAYELRPLRPVPGGGDGQWVAIADDPLVFLSNRKFLAEHGLKPPASWDDLLHPAYKNMLQMADARTSGTAVTRIFSILEVHGRNEDKAFEYLKKKRKR